MDEAKTDQEVQVNEPIKHIQSKGNGHSQGPSPIKVHELLHASSYANGYSKKDEDGVYGHGACPGSGELSGNGTGIGTAKD